MSKIRLMRVFNPHLGRSVWVPRMLWESGYKVDNINQAPGAIRVVIGIAEEYNRAERRRN